MTDLETIKEMFKRAGIKYVEENLTESTLTVEAGYMGFYSLFTFEADGSLKSVEAYE